MGCMCSVPAVKYSERKGCSTVKSFSSGAVSVKSMFRRRPLEKNSEVPPDPTIPIQDLFILASEISEQYFKNSVNPVLLTAIVVIESSGDPKLKQWKCQYEAWAYGLGQMLFSTANELVQNGYTAFKLKSEQDLYDSKAALYFTAAYLDYLSKQNLESSEEFLVKAYHRGPKHAQEASLELWDIYLKASSQLIRLKTAMNCENHELENIHIVQPGENLKIIARICGIAPEDIIGANPDVKETNSLQTGDCIEIPVQNILPRLYAVKKGDSIDSIAHRHDISTFRLIKFNADIKTPDSLRQGWILSIPGLKGESVVTGMKTDLISAGLEDGPFVQCPRTVQCDLDTEDEDINSALGGQHQSGFSPDYFRQRYRVGASSSIGKLFGVSIGSRRTRSRRRIQHK
eukprot:g8706.t1